MRSWLIVLLVFLICSPPVLAESIGSPGAAIGFPSVGSGGGGGGGGSPGGSTGQVQYKASGSSFGGLTTVVYASAAGIRPCSPSNPQAGPDQSAQVQTVLNLAQNGPLLFIVDEPILCQQCSVFSNTTIQGLGAFINDSNNNNIPAGLWMGTVTNSTNSCILKNAHWASPYQGGTITDQNIIIKDLYLDGQYRNGVAGASGQQWNNNFFYLSPMQLWGINGLRLENVSIYDACTGFVEMANVFHVYVNNLRCVIGPSGSTLMDGFHLNGPADDITVDGLYLKTDDDAMAITAVDANVSTVSNPGHSGPTIWGSFNNVYCGTINHIVITNVVMSNADEGLRLGQGTDARSGGATGTVQNCIISNVTGTCGKPITAGTQANITPGGVFANILLKGWQLSPLGTTADQGLDFGGFYQNLILRDFQFLDGNSGTTAGICNQIQLGGSYTGGVTLDNCKWIENSSAPASPTPAISVSGNMDACNILNCDWDRGVQTTASFISVTGGTTNALNVRNCNVNNAAHIISVTGGSVPTINTSGISHRNAGSSNSSITLGSGITVGRLRSCGSDTVQLWDGTGTITSEKTDSTQDS